MSAAVRICQSILLMLALAGLYLVWMLASANGTIALMKQVRDRGPQTLPGTQEALKRHYTGLAFIDYRLTVLGLLFWQQLDGSHPDAALHCFYFAGQILAVWPLFMLEKSWAGNRWRVISFLAVWGLAIQVFSYAVVMPLYLTLYLSTSCQSDFRVRKAQLDMIWPALTVGYAIPTILMAVPAPSMLSYDAKQGIMAVWQFFPLWVELLHHFRAKDGRFATSTEIAQFYRVCLILAIATQTLTCCGIIILSSVSSFRHVLIPETVFPEPVHSIGQGMHLLLKWDQLVGSSAVIIWALAQCCQADATLSPFKIIFHLAAGGPIALGIHFLQMRHATLRKEA